ncbi:FadR family transcriptional regulator [Chitinophaga costaii]|nr:FadR/GntR family transcriptional regulator [Chitinophaga costaii]PUZ26806.1 FadR family transcriptional regulator [Chitinophaga costaii]
MMNKHATIIKKRSLADEVAGRLQEQISQGVYPVNGKLPIEPELMKTFGVGRSTIREAIRSLVNAGFLRVQQGLGTFVEPVFSSPTPIDQRLKRANLNDLNEVRQLLEMKIAEKAAQFRTQEDIQHMQDCLNLRQHTAATGNVAATIEADIAFHTAVANAAQNEILSDLYKVVSVYLKKGFEKIYNDTSVFLDTHQLHEQLLAAIVAGNRKQAWDMVTKIIDNVDK